MHRSALDSLRAWQRDGERVALEGGRVFVKRAGAGRHLTLLHGFPTCSWDWSKIWDELVEQRTVLAMDLLGFGHSDKPNRPYSFAEHADRVEVLWRRDRVESTTLVAHDYSVTLALELLARSDALPVHIDGVVFLNGALRGRLHRARLIQTVLASAIGPAVARLVRRPQFERAFCSVFEHAPSADELAAFWASASAQDGQLRSPQLLHYIRDRREQAGRWEGVLDSTRVPLSFIWGVKDPVSGKHVLESVEHRGTVTALPVGHYPHWEAPTEVLEAILAATRA
ncbi:MAG: alpha/beta hydrolase [Myxococcota bacterium]